MSKFSKITLLAVAAFLLLGFSITAIAAKPDKVHTLTSAPLISHGVYCLVVNTTEEIITIDLNVYNTAGLLAGGTVDVDPSQSRFSGNGGEVKGSPAYCVVGWYGQKGDVRATFCAQDDQENIITDTQTCLELD